MESSAPYRGKYRTMARYLEALSTAEARLTLEEIEGILGFSLPSTACQRKAWWRAGDGLPHVRAWEDQGFRAVPFLEEGVVLFRREPGIPPPEAPGNVPPRDPTPEVPVLPWEELLRATPPKPVVEAPDAFDESELRRDSFGAFLLEVFRAMAAQGQLFHSKDDLTFMLAWEMKERWRGPRPLEVRPEFFPVAGSPPLDVVCVLGEGDCVPLSLWYVPGTVPFCVSGRERRMPRDPAVDRVGWEFLKGLRHLEETLRREPAASLGFVALLTNHAPFWRPEGEEAPWGLGEGCRKAGILRGTLDGAPISVALTGSYDLRWLPYGDAFRLLLVPVRRKTA